MNFNQIFEFEFNLQFKFLFTFLGVVSIVVCLIYEWLWGLDLCEWCKVGGMPERPRTEYVFLKYFEKIDKIFKFYNKLKKLQNKSKNPIFDERHFWSTPFPQKKIFFVLQRKNFSFILYGMYEI